MRERPRCGSWPRAPEFEGRRHANLLIQVPAWFSGTRISGVQRPYHLRRPGEGWSREALPEVRASKSSGRTKPLHLHQDKRLNKIQAARAFSSLPEPEDDRFGDGNPPTGVWSRRCTSIQSRLEFPERQSDAAKSKESEFRSTEKSREEARSQDACVIVLSCRTYDSGGTQFRTSSRRGAGSDALTQTVCSESVNR